MKISVTRRFAKGFSSLPNKIKAKAISLESVFRKNPFDGRLKTHKLAGKNREAWAFSIDYSHRTVFIFLADKAVLFLDIGNHEIHR